MTRRQALYAVAAGVIGCRMAIHLVLIHVPHSTSPAVWLRGVGAALCTAALPVVFLTVSGAWLVVCLALLVRATRGEMTAFLAERRSATVLLVTAFAWSAPMLLGPGVLLHDDWATLLRACALALDSLRSLELPAWSFVAGNGVSYTLQYPPLSILAPAGAALLTHLPLETCLKLLTASMHGLFLAGGYRFLRALHMQRLAAAAGVVVVALTQQYWASAFIHGAFASLIASSLLPLSAYALVKTLRTGAARYAALSGVTVGSVAMAQPVAALFTLYSVALAILGVLLFRPALVITRRFSLLLAAALSALVAAPFIATVLAFRPYNQYQFSQVATFQFPPVSFGRWFWWSPMIGLPPGTGSDNSGYVGIAIAAANAMAIGFSVRRPTTPRGNLYLSCLVWGLILVYGTPLGIYHVIPFGPLAKGTYRLWPFLAIALMLGVAIAVERLLRGRRYVLASALILIGMLENAPFSLKPAFPPPDVHASEVLSQIPATLETSTLVASPDHQNRGLLQSVFREISLGRRSDLSYIHHEEHGVVGTRYWQLRDVVARADPGTDWRAISDQLRWLRVTHVIVLGRRAADYPGLGSASTRAVGGTPVTTVALGTPFPMKRWPDAASIQVSADEINPDGSIRLPISYHPLLRVRSEGRALSTRPDGGYLSVCCVRSPGSWLDIEAHAPPWLKWLYALSVGSLLGTLALFVRRRE